MTRVAIAVRPTSDLRSGLPIVDADGFRFLKEETPFDHKGNGALLAPFGTSGDLVVVHVAARTHDVADTFTVEVIEPDGDVKHERMVTVPRPIDNLYSPAYVTSIGVLGGVVYGTTAAWPPYWNGIDPPEKGSMSAWYVHVADASRPAKVRRVPGPLAMVPVGSAKIGDDVFIFGNPTTGNTGYAIRANTRQLGFSAATLPFENEFGTVYQASYDGATVFIAAQNGLFMYTWNGTTFQLVSTIKDEPCYSVSSTGNGRTAAACKGRIRRLLGAGADGIINHAALAGTDALTGVSIGSDGAVAALAGSGNVIQTWKPDLSPDWNQLLGDATSTFRPCPVPVSYGTTCRQLLVLP